MNEEDPREVYIANLEKTIGQLREQNKRDRHQWKHEVRDVQKLRRKIRTLERQIIGFKSLISY